MSPLLACHHILCPMWAESGYLHLFSSHGVCHRTFFSVDFQFIIVGTQMNDTAMTKHWGNNSFLRYERQTAFASWTHSHECLRARNEIQVYFCCARFYLVKASNPLRWFFMHRWNLITHMSLWRKKLCLRNFKGIQHSISLMIWPYCITHCQTEKCLAELLACEVWDAFQVICLRILKYK